MSKLIKITTPASSQMLTTREMVLEAWVGKDPDSDLVDLAILSASRTISTWCRREFIQQVYTERLEAPERRNLVLSEYPVLESPVPVVTADGDAVTSFEVYGDKGFLYRSDGYAWTGPTQWGGLLGASPLAYDREPTIVALYTAGWITRAMAEIDTTTADLPGDIEDSTIYFAIQLLKSNAGKPLGDPTGVKIGNFTTFFPSADSMSGSGSGYWAESIGDPMLSWMPLRVRRALLPYRKTI